jgi:hypothetical protein
LSSHRQHGSTNSAIATPHIFLSVYFAVFAEFANTFGKGTLRWLAVRTLKYNLK